MDYIQGRNRLHIKNKHFPNTATADSPVTYLSILLSQWDVWHIDGLPLYWTTGFTLWDKHTIYTNFSIQRANYFTKPQIMKNIFGDFLSAIFCAPAIQGRDCTLFVGDGEVAVAAERLCHAYEETVSRMLVWTER